MSSFHWFSLRWLTNNKKDIYGGHFDHHFVFTFWILDLFLNYKIQNGLQRYLWLATFTKPGLIGLLAKIWIPNSSSIPIPTEALTEGPLLPDQHHELVHPPPVQADPLSGQGSHKTGGIEQRRRFIGAETVDHGSDWFCKLFLNQRLVRHPEAVVQAFPQAHHFKLKRG